MVFNLRKDYKYTHPTCFVFFCSQRQRKAFCPHLDPWDFGLLTRVQSLMLRMSTETIVTLRPPCSRKNWSVSHSLRIVPTGNWYRIGGKTFWLFLKKRGLCIHKIVLDPTAERMIRIICDPLCLLISFFFYSCTMADFYSIINQALLLNKKKDRLINDH